MRLIDADNILDFIDNAIKTAHGIGLRPAAALCLKKRIEDEPTIDPVQRWIPVSERLPEKGINVIVTDDGETTAGFRSIFGGWRDLNGDELFDVTAWIPIPEPYKGGEE